MSAITAVELGADTCALARTAVRRGELRVFAAEVLDPTQFPGIEAFTLALRKSRRALRLPRRCRVVVWGLREGARRHDPAVVPVLRPLVEAGFRVERVVSPCNALAALARLKSVRGEGATCWLAVNRGGVAIVVVRPGRQLYAHSFVWDWMLGATGSQARLLQRYSLVSALAPEVRRAMAAAVEKGTRVDAIVTCGNLPDLRSLTMPLIEELDVEVETLDSLEGLEVAPDVAEKLTDVAQAIRLACAGANARRTRPRDEGERRRHHVGRWLRIAALIAGICAVGYLSYATWSSSRHAAVTTSARPGSQAKAGAKTPDSNRRPPMVARQSLPVQPKATAPPPPTTSTPTATVPSARTANPIATAPASPARNATAGAPPPITAKITAQPKTPASPQRSSVQPTVTAPAPGARPPVTPAPRVVQPIRPADASRMPVDSRPAPTRDIGGLSTPAVPADKVETRRPRPMPALLKEPAPRVTAILVTNDRRYATVDRGRIVGIGEVVGRRVVVEIDEQTVLFREPSGALIRVSLGGRVVGPERQQNR